MDNLASGYLGERGQLGQPLKPQTLILYLKRIKTHCGHMRGPGCYS